MNIDNGGVALEIDKLKNQILEHTVKESVVIVRGMLDELCSQISSQSSCSASNIIKLLMILGHLSCIVADSVADEHDCWRVFELCKGFLTDIESAQLIKELNLNVRSINMAKSTRHEIRENWQDHILLENKAFIEHRKIAAKAISDVFSAYHCKIGLQKIVRPYFCNSNELATVFSCLVHETDRYMKSILENETFFCIVSDVVFRQLAANPYLDDGDFKDWLLRIIQPRTNFAELIRYRKIYGREEVDDLFLMLESFKPQASETELLKLIHSFAAEHFIKSLINSSVPEGHNLLEYDSIFLQRKDEETFGVALAGKFYLIYTSTIFSSGFRINTGDSERLKIKLKKNFGGILFCDTHLSNDGKLFISIVNYSDSDELINFKSNFMSPGESFICIPYKFIAEKKDDRACFFEKINQTNAAAKPLKFVEHVSAKRKILFEYKNSLTEFCKTILSPFPNYQIHAAVATFVLIVSLSTLFINQNEISVQSVALLTRPTSIQFRGSVNFPQLERIEQSGYHLTSGQTFQLQYEIKKSRYVLVIYINSSNQHTVLLNEKQNKGIYTLPNEHSTYQLDNVPGTESVYILTSKKTMLQRTVIDILKEGDMDGIIRKGINVQHISFVHTP